MEIIRKKDSSHRFVVSKSFQWNLSTLAVGKEIEMREPDATAMVKSGRLDPVIPDPVECVALQDLNLEGRDEAHAARRNERILLRKKQAVELMLQRLVIPASDDVWRPFEMRLKRDDRGKAKRLADERDKAALDSKLYDIGIHPAQTQKRR